MSLWPYSITCMVIDFPTLTICIVERTAISRYLWCCWPHSNRILKRLTSLHTVVSYNATCSRINNATCSCWYSSIIGVTKCVIHYTKYKYQIQNGFVCTNFWSLTSLLAGKCTRTIWHQMMGQSSNFLCIDNKLTCIFKWSCSSLLRDWQTVNM